VEKRRLSSGTTRAMKSIKDILTHPYLAFVFRLYVAGLFIYASMYKINYTAEFSQTIASYELLPHWAVNVSAVTLPWVELICGILLVTGIRVRSATLIIALLLTTFAVAIFINLLRDSPIGCGCFHTIEDTISWWTFFRDVLWVIMAVHIFLYDRVLHLERKFSLILKEV
jgi:putative oxidoreductase